MIFEEMTKLVSVFDLRGGVQVENTDQLGQLTSYSVSWTSAVSVFDLAYINAKILTGGIKRLLHRVCQKWHFLFAYNINIVKMSHLYQIKLAPLHRILWKIYDFIANCNF